MYEAAERSTTAVGRTAIPLNDQGPRPPPRPDERLCGRAAHHGGDRLPKSCKVPMASVAMVASPGSGDGMVRIRSGSYLSPAFRVTAVALRVAIAFPAPYATGHSVLSVIRRGRRAANLSNTRLVRPDIEGRRLAQRHLDTREPALTERFRR